LISDSHSEIASAVRSASAVSDDPTTIAFSRTIPMPAGQLCDDGLVLAAEPSPNVAVPPSVQRLIAGRPARAVWENELGGLTYEVAGSERCFLKWMPATSGIDLSTEVARLNWAVAFSPVPRVLGHGADDAGSWIITAPLPGDNAVSDQWRAEPGRAVSAIGTGLRALHEALPVQTCPFLWSVAGRRDEIHPRAAAGRLVSAHWQEAHRSLGVQEALGVLADAPPIDQLVVCHGDACAPNTLLSDDGSWSGHVDLGSLGVADRWADLAVATWSTQWNYGPGWEHPLLEAYGVEPDPERTAYYRLMWDLGS
jgi:aminoglycoside phosphotransferase